MDVQVVRGANESTGQGDVRQDSIMNSVDRYRREWLELISSLNDFEAIQLLGFNGELKVSKFRSIYWALLLRVLNCEHTSWSEQRMQQRNRYEKLKLEFAKNPHIERAPNDDPLSQSKQSVWNQYFSDQELVAVIKQDVVRTFPGVDFFRKPLIQNAMINILFCYAREHPYMCYRQGMHEILAPILFVLYGDHQALLHFKELNRSIDDLLMDVLNPEFLEADSYTLFARVMSSIESYYRISNLVQTENGYFCVQNEQNLSNSLTTEVEVIGQLNSIRDKILAKEDLHLHNYLLKLDIPLHIFGIRWLRLLFGREFALLDLLVLWDAIFADGDRFDLPNYILVAMLIRIRDRLLCNDYTTCLTYLMRYPTNVDINLILRHALHMQYPKRFECPANAFIYFTMASDTAQAGQPSQQKSHSSKEVPTTNKAALKSTVLQGKPEVPLESNRSSTLSNSEVRFQQKITDIQHRIAWESALRARLKATPESDKVIIDGYSENSPELLRLELKNAQTIIDISKSKLQTYLETIKRNLSRNPPEELCQAVDGIEELCSFLDVKFIFPFNSRSQRIDQALEADENRQLKPTETRVKRDSLPMPNGNASNADSQQASEEDEDFVVMEQNEAESDLSVPVTVSGTTAYERPDNGSMVSRRRILGNRREVELIPITTDEKLVLDQRPSLQGVPSVDPIGYRDD